MMEEFGLSRMSSARDQNLADMIAESEEIVKESKNSALRSKGYTEDIKEIGSSTMTKLHHQGSQLETMSRKLDVIDEDVHEGKRQIRSVESIFGSLRNKFSKKSKPKKDKFIPKSVPTVVPIIVPPVKLTVPAVPQVQQNYELFSHLSEEAQRDIRDTADVLESISKDLDDIRTMSLQMGAEISRHNEILDNISPQMIETTGQIQKLTRRTRRQF